MRILGVVLAISTAMIAMVACKKSDNGPKRDQASAKPVAQIDAAPPPKAVPPPPLPPVTGETSVALGEKSFKKNCANCHGEDGKGNTTDSASLAHAPTDLTSARYLCRSTNGRPVAVPSDVDVEGAVGRGTHKSVPQLAAIPPAERRSLTLYVKTLAKDFAGDAQPLYEVPKETLDDAGSRQRGRMLFLNWGCHQCHGLGGKGDGDPKALQLIKWNDHAVPMPDLTAHDKYLCGGDAERVYRTVALGEALIMPPYADMAMLNWRPEDGKPEDWAKSLDGKLSADEMSALRAYISAQPEKHEVTEMKPADRQARAAGLLWDVVHYVRSMN
jgi:mono/diheme cytochrome c family protein